MAERWEKGLSRPFAFDPNSTVNEGRFRLYLPELIAEGSYYRQPSGSLGVSFVKGENIKTGKIIIQAIRFNKSIISEEKASEWWQINKNKFSFYQGE
jgi:hypothetical protein